MLTSPTMKTSEKWMMMNKNANTNYHCIWNCSSKYNMYKYTHIYIYIYIYIYIGRVKRFTKQACREM